MTTLNAGIAALSSYCVLALVVGVLGYGRKLSLPIFDAFIEGAASAFDVALRIIPYLVGIFVAYEMLRDAGAIDALQWVLAPLLRQIGVPSEILPLAIVRPFSGSASIAILAELMQKYGGDSLLAMMGGTILGSTETTLYVAAVYFGAVGVKHTRHAIAASLCGEAVGFLAAVYICQWLLGA